MRTIFIYKIMNTWKTIIYKPLTHLSLNGFIIENIISNTFLVCNIVLPVFNVRITNRTNVLANFKEKMY